MTCDTCGKELELGAWPWCPHDAAKGMKYIEDAIPGGMVFENGFDTPQTFYSHSEHRAALAARGLQIGAKWAGEHDKHLKRMDIPCATTLANAKALLSRTKGAPFAPEDAHIPITVTPITFTKDAECS